MSTNTKITIVTLGLILVAGYLGAGLYQDLKPKPRPLKQRAEVTLTIIPGWNLRQVAEYLVQKEFASSTEDVYKITGEPAKVYIGGTAPTTLASSTWNCNKIVSLYADCHSNQVSAEGYLAPETVRVFADASLNDVLKKFITLRDQEFFDTDFKPGLYNLNAYIGTKAEDFGSFQTNEPSSSYISAEQILTMASIIEKETKYEADRARVADILWRRFAVQMALQVDSSVHYAVDKTGTIFTTAQERQINSPWNTYKYPGLPPGPICNPSIESIRAALAPERNNYWYFLSGKDGKMYYAKTLEVHNRNKKYL